MKKLLPFLPVFPLLVALFFVVRSFMIFKVMVVPKYEAMGSTNSVFEDGDYYMGYPQYFTASVAVLMFLLFFFVIVGLKKPQYDSRAALFLGSVAALYIVNLNSALASALVFKVILDDDMVRQEKRLTELRDGMNSCGCLECVNDFRSGK